MAEREVLVLCYWNCSIKYGPPDGVCYEGGTPKMISVKQKTELSRLLDGLCIITGVDKQKSSFKLFGRYPFSVSPHQVSYIHIPLVDNATLASMLEVPIKHPCIKYVELYLDVKPISDGSIVPAACSLPLDTPCSSSKRPRIQQPQEATGCADVNVTYPPVKLERDIGLEIQGVDNSNRLIEDEVNADFGNGETTDKNSRSDGLAQMVNDSNAGKDLNVPGLEASTNASKPRLISSLWVDDLELSVGLCFKDIDELKKAVDWCSIRGKQKCVLKETKKDEYMFECIRWKCNWSLHASRIEEHGLVEISKCSGSHTCSPIKPEIFNLEFAAEQIECQIRVQPTLTVAELDSWWFEKFGYELKTSVMKEVKQEVIKKLYGDWDQSFRVLPKLMAALHSSNGLVVDLLYDVFPNREFASFCGLFWAFSQHIEGFQHCKPLILVDIKDLNGKYPMKLMIALGVDAEDYYFPLAFAVTKEVSVDSWRWFLSGIREKVTQRKGICLISSPHPDLLAVVNEPESQWKEPWAYHRFCLDSLSSQFDDVFHNNRLKSLMKQAGYTKQQGDFDYLMKTIKKENPGARRWLDRMPPHQWALAHDGGRRFGVMAVMKENFCESVWSLGLPVTATILLLFDELRLDFHQGLCDSRGRLNCGEMYTTSVMDKLEEFRTASVIYIVMPFDNNSFRVTQSLQKDGWIVQLNDSTCTCGEFQVNKFPCLHALAVCEKLKVNPLQYVDNCHSLEELYRTYAASFNPVPEVSAWPEASAVPQLFPPIIPQPSPPTIVPSKSRLKTTPRTMEKKKKSSIFL